MTRPEIAPESARVFSAISIYKKGETRDLPNSFAPLLPFRNKVHYMQATGIFIQEDDGSAAERERERLIRKRSMLQFWVVFFFLDWMTSSASLPSKKAHEAYSVLLYFIKAIAAFKPV